MRSPSHTSTAPRAQPAYSRPSIFSLPHGTTCGRGAGSRSRYSRDVREGNRNRCALRRRSQRVLGGNLLEDHQRRRRSDVARILRDLLRQQILSGLISGRLPPDELSATTFGVSRNAVRDAYGLLANEGLIERRRRTGTWTVSAKYSQDVLNLRGLRETFEIEGGRIHNVVRLAEIQTAPDAVAARLDMGQPRDVVLIERVRYVDDEAISLDITYIPVQYGAFLIHSDLREIDIFPELERRLSTPLGFAVNTVEAVNADFPTSELLMVDEGAPLILLTRVTHLATGQPIDLEYVRYRGDRMSLSFIARRGGTA
jgi:GntR family transcriptional regulator